MMVEGYGQTLNVIKYWILRNSWGHMWGEGGYMRIICGASNPGGLRGIATDVYYPIIY
ncbi:KDEL-tailed cysteine endopeptidase CEP3 [Platanthera zijinensis]|uniref:KDEL-tailed cysteine endopeptidase CEP3 n=1 Tax=Platanthera zijinensis TaxID=2320716 RepID=A0AAP0B399_9ASPA